jgi:pimeloyl-ACP methyl ester carboxylesterase
MPEINEYKLPTSHATLAISEVGNNEPVLLLIHGNSFCRKIWRHILGSPLSKTHRIIAFDLPGHGESSNATNPEHDYTQPGYAHAAIELLTKLEVKEVIVFGWSLGGHVGIEMIPLAPAAGLKIRGLMIVGTPPVGYGDLDKGFMLGPKGWKASLVRLVLSHALIIRWCSNRQDKEC